MRILVAALVLALVVAGTIYFFAGMEGDSSPAATPDDPLPAVEDIERVIPEDDARLAGPSPDNRPPLKAFALNRQVGVLLLMGVPQRVNAQLALFWDANPRVELITWAAQPADDTVPVSRLPGALAAPPTAAVFADGAVDVVYLHDLDPNALSPDFWRAVAMRVEEGKLGLVIQPGVGSGQAMLDHEILGPILPVATCAPIEGQPVPGVYNALAPFEVTRAGQRHPATRLVDWPSWSRMIWYDMRRLETPWGTRFCYPVLELADGAKVLVETDPSGRLDVAYPAIVAGDAARGRVLWVGAWGFGSRHAYGRPNVLEDWKLLSTNWVAWLSGQVPE